MKGLKEKEKKWRKKDMRRKEKKSTYGPFPRG